MILQDVVENIVEIKDSLIDCNAGCLLPFQQYFSYIVMAIAPIHDFLEFF